MRLESAQCQLDAMLADSPALADERARVRVDELRRASGDRIVLYGAGGVGRRTLAGLRRHGIEPVAFADATSHEQVIGGVPVLSPDSAAASYGDSALFVVTIWNSATPYLAVESDLRRRGCKRITSCAMLFQRYPDTFLPYYGIDRPRVLIEAASLLREALLTLSDDESREVFLGVVRWALQLDFSGGRIRPASEQYFPAELELHDREVFVDVGAFDGDTLSAFATKTHGRFAKVIAFEPDAVNFGLLQRRTDAVPDAVRNSVQLYCAAVGDSLGSVTLGGTGAACSASSAGIAGGRAVECVTLDDVLGSDVPTFIKFDVEGMEVAALSGGRSAIERNSPTLAVCAYHRLCHLWDIPVMLRQLSSRYSVYLRQYAETPWETVYYAIPLARAWRSACPPQVCP